MKFLNKKISLSLVIASVFITAAVVFPISYNLAMNKFNKILLFNDEKQQMYQKLSDIDSEIRRESILEIDEQYLRNEICNGYVKGTKSSFCNYFSKEEYREFNNKVLLDPIFSENFDENVGYLQVKNFEKNSADNFISFFDGFIQNGITNIVLDLRNVEDADFEQISKILAFLMPKGDIIKSVNKKGEKEIVCRSVSEKTNANMVVIVNEKTKGISELIAGALKDEKMAKIVGKTTPGEATQKKVFNFVDGSVLIYPFAHYVTKNEEIFYKRGIIPDLNCDLSEEKQKLFEKDNLNFEDDDQLQKAVEIFYK